MSTQSLFFEYTAASVVFWFLLRHFLGRKTNPQGLPFPPGPSPLPIIGNLHQISQDHAWLKYTEWGKQYGQLVYFRLLNQDVILINTRKAALDLLEKHSGVYSDRPRHFVMASELLAYLLGWNQGVALAPTGPRHRQFRRLLGGTLNQSAVRTLRPLQKRGIQNYLKLLAANPGDFYEQVSTSISETMVMICFGQECSRANFPYIDMAEKTHIHFNLSVTPFTFAVDIFPILRYIPEWFPGAGFKKTARFWKAELEELVRFPLRLVKNDLSNGTALPSYLGGLFNTKNTVSPEEESVMLWSAMSLYSGGVDTSAASILTFLLTMCLHPEAQAKAQKELDDVIGPDRLPTFSDRTQLPYLNACMKEVMRWLPVAPLGVAHRAVQTNYYEGRCIPEGATVISNLWAMSRDPEIYHRPDEFLPERFLPADSYTVPDALNSFGFGRRICPGQYLADSSLFLYMACTLAVFNIGRAKDDQGNEIVPKVEVLSGLIAVPKPFECSITVRSDRAEQLIAMD